jgi:hypothetical protein
MDISNDVIINSVGLDRTTDTHTTYHLGFSLQPNCLVCRLPNRNNNVIQNLCSYGLIRFEQPYRLLFSPLR